MNGIFEFRPAKDFKWRLSGKVALGVEDLADRRVVRRYAATAIENQNPLAHRFEYVFEPLFSIGQFEDLPAEVLRHRVQRCAQGSNLFVSGYRQSLVKVARSKLSRGHSHLV